MSASLNQAASARLHLDGDPDLAARGPPGFYTRIRAGKQPPFLGGASMQDLYGISGLPTFPQLTGGLNTQNISGFTGMGRQATNPQFQNPTTWIPRSTTR